MKNCDAKNWWNMVVTWLTAHSSLPSPSFGSRLFWKIYAWEFLGEKTVLLLKTSHSGFFINFIGFHCRSYSVCFLASSKFLIYVVEATLLVYQWGWRFVFIYVLSFLSAYFYWPILNNNQTFSISLFQLCILYSSSHPCLFFI